VVSVEGEGLGLDKTRHEKTMVRVRIQGIRMLWLGVRVRARISGWGFG
jgi:hypothetical protein